jgi:hypothetical protein
VLALPVGIHLGAVIPETLRDLLKGAELILDNLKPHPSGFPYPGTQPCRDAQGGSVPPTHEVDTMSNGVSDELAVHCPRRRFLN